MKVEDIHPGGIYERRGGKVRHRDRDTWIHWTKRREVISISSGDGPATVRYSETSNTGTRAASGVWTCDLGVFARWAHRRVLAGGAA